MAYLSARELARLHSSDLAFVLVRAVLGALLVSFAVFLYENQEGKIQNVIEEWWIRLHDAQIASTSKAAAFLKAIAQTSERGFAYVYGEKIISLRMLGVSYCFSWASYLMAPWASWFLIIIPRRYVFTLTWKWAGSSFITVLECTFFILLALVPSITRKNWIRLVWGDFLCVHFVSLVAVTVYPTYSARGAIAALRITDTYVELLVMSLAYDILYVGVTRLILRRVSASQSAGEIAFMLVANIFLSEVLVALPAAIGSRLFNAKPIGHLGIAWTVMFVFNLNFIAFFASLAFLVVAAFTLAHRLLWPLAERPLYALARHGAIRHRRWLFGVGIALLTSAIPGLPQWLKEVLRRL